MTRTTKLPLFKTTLASTAGAALLALGASAHAQQVETVEFEGPAGVTLTGVLYTPADYEATADHPAVVMLHGCTGIWSNRTPGATNADGTPNLQNHVEKWGLAVDSYTPREPETLDTTDLAARQAWQNQCAGEVNGGKVDPYTTRVLDARAAYDFLTTEERVDDLRVGLLGWSQGAQSALVEAADKSRDTNALRDTDDLLFSTTVVFYPGCGTNLGFGTSVSYGWWRPYVDLRMNMGKLDGFHGMCKTRMTRANTLAASLSSPPSIEFHDYTGADHSFDAVSQDWPEARCAEASPTGDECAMFDADIESLEWFETYL
ncbi:MAG: hypothetical protein IT385_11470 [Deltaproteobacteria bacterium]|nr:hypothetical protein [Deltaproteobacteria bacterium]